MAGMATGLTYEDMARRAEADQDPMLPVAPDDDVIQLYTSGTTGHPKGVQLTMRELSRDHQFRQHRYGARHLYARRCGADRDADSSMWRA